MVLEQMKNNADKESGVFTAVFEQNWLHIRQKENERIWITNIYVLIVAGALSFLKFSNHINLYVVPFLLILSILNFFFIVKLNAVIKDYVSRIEKIIEKLEMEEYAGLRVRGGIWGWISMDNLFIGFYIIMIIVWCSALCLL